MGVKNGQALLYRHLQLLTIGRSRRRIQRNLLQCWNMASHTKL